MERIPNRTSTPLYGEFYEANGINNAVSIGNIGAGEMIGLWFCRRLVEDLATLVVQESNIYETNPNDTDLMQTVVLDKQDQISINFRWGVEYYGGPVGGELV